MGELGPVVPNGDYAGQAWDDDVIKAQAIASRTWGAYWCHKHELMTYYSPWLWVAKGVLDGQGDQVYRPNYKDFPSSTKQNFIKQSNQVRDLYLTYDGLNLYQAPFDGKLIDAQFRADVGNPSCSWRSSDTRRGCKVGNRDVTGYDYLPKVNNPHHTGRIYGPGFAQIPAQAWTRRNTGQASWYQLLTHYYSGIQIMNRHSWFRAEYYNNTSCSGSPAAINYTKSINYDWGTGSPTSGVKADNFCVEFENREIDFPDLGPGNNQYTFFILADDGFRLYVDDKLVLDKWFAQSPHQYSVTMNMTPGKHKIRLKYYEAGIGAVIRMSWMPSFGMVGQYLDYPVPPDEYPPLPLDRGFIMRPDPIIQFDWEIYSPLDIREGLRYQTDTFGVLWQGNIYTPTCQTTAQFGTMSDDGVILSVDNQIVINQWHDHAPTHHAGNKALCNSTGRYPVELRYYENGGGAAISLSGVWQ